jgi:hypothetical protein
MAWNTAQLMLKCEPDGNGCMVFTGHKSKSGYGQIWFRGKRMWAHRAFYIAFKGEIPEGQEIDHLCRKRSCVLPRHLEAVSHQENQRRGNSFAGKRARQTHCIHGHAFTPENTMVKKDGRRNCRACQAKSNAAYYQKSLIN